MPSLARILERPDHTYHSNDEDVPDEADCKDDPEHDRYEELGQPRKGPVRPSPPGSLAGRENRAQMRRRRPRGGGGPPHSGPGRVARQVRLVKDILF